MAKLTKRVRAAIEASIKHWEEAWAEPNPCEINLGRDQCALCALFWDDDCERCPVFVATGAIHCEASPYVAAFGAKQDWLGRYTANLFDKDKKRTRWKIQARKEINFLKSLLEEAPGHAKPD